MFRSYPSASASVAPPPSRDEEYVSLTSTRPPTKDDLFILKAIPAGMAGASNARSSRPSRGKGKRTKLAKEGQIVSVLYDSLGRRPYPVNSISMEQGITIEMVFHTQAFLTATALAGTYAYNSRSFVLSDFSGASSLETVFDQYRFDQIECWLDTTTPNNGNPMSTLYSTVDLDDAAVATTPGLIQDHPGAIVSVLPGGHYHKWRPHMAIAAYSGAFTSYSNAPPLWIDVASPNVQHYGLKTAILSTGTAYVMDLTVRAVISFRAPVIN